MMATMKILIVDDEPAISETLAYALRHSGLRILLIERGDYLPQEPQNWEPKVVFDEKRYKPHETWYGADGKPFQPGVHYFVGGNTKVYGAALFRLRIALAERVRDALQLELQAGGGRAYHRDQPLGFARRWAESAFIPIVTPSLTQLQGELLKQAGGTRVAA